MEWQVNLENLPQVAAAICSTAGPRAVIALHGPMGSGKTTLVSAICRHLGIHEAVTSPTFSLINEYRLPNGQPFYHIDLYRIRDEQEAEQAGIGDCLHSGAFCAVEWPELAPGLLSPETVHVYLEPTGPDTRTVKLEYPIGNA
jgi:tRNA threonylcarbamoyladenosine biosynthesis protein TsaE